MVQVERRETIVLERWKMYRYIYVYMYMYYVGNVASRECRLWNNTPYAHIPISNRYLL